MTRNLTRFVAVIAAVLANLGLYVLMEAMLERPAQKRGNLIETQPIEFVRSITDEEPPQRERRRPPPPKPPETPPPRTLMDMSIVPTATDLPMDRNLDIVGLLGVGSGIAVSQQLGHTRAGSTGMAVVDASTLIPVSMLPPQYPSRALSQGVEGWVQVLFEVDSAGHVRNPVVVAEEPVGIFDRAALAAVERWRFRPPQSDSPIYAHSRLVFETKQ